MSQAAGPVDVRWVPALLLCLVLGQGASGWSGAAGAAVSVGCGAVAVVAGIGLAASRTRGGRRRGVLTAAVLAGVAGALLVQQVSVDRSGHEAAGWDDVVAAGKPVRLEVRAAGPAQTREARFGTAWSQPVTVERFGHPLTAVTPPPEALLAGSGVPPAVATGDVSCVVAGPRLEGGALWLDARAATQGGACPEDGAAPREGQTTAPAGAATGRDRLQAAFRDAAADAVGTAPELIPGLVLGDRSAQSEELEQAMKDAGLSHLSAVSGANCALLLGAVTVGLRSLRVHRTAVVVAAMATLVVFVVVVGPEPSVLRAAVMGGLGALAVFLGRSRAAFSLLSAGGTLLLVVAPDLASEVAFHLSLAATAGIVLVAAPVDRWIHARVGTVLPDVVARWLSSSLAVTGAAHLACQPILLAMTGTLSTWAVPANLAAAPAVAPVTVLGTLAAAGVVPLPWAADALVWLIQWPAAFIGLVATTAAAAPGAVRPWPPGPVGLALGVLLTVATLAGFRAVLLWERTRQAPVRRVGRSAPPRRSRISAGTVLTAALVSAALGTCGAVLVPRPAGEVPANWSVAFCDVGQGDMTVARTGEDSALVVDVGPDADLARRCLDDLDVRRVDAVLLTHLHADHAGGLDGVSGALAPAEVLYATRESAADGGAAGAPRGEEPGVGPPAGATRLSTGDVGTAGEVSWRVLLADARAAEENDASAQILLTVTTPDGPVGVLVTGDMEEGVSAPWARGHRSDAPPPARVDVLKVAHHGARNGGLAVPEAVHARLHAISVGADNDYGHPHPATLAGLETIAPVARTDRLGTFVLVRAPDGALTAQTVRVPRSAAP